MLAAHAIQRIVLVLMVGGLWIIGYVVAPALFSFLQDDNLAGEIAGQMFHLVSWIVLISGLVLILSMVVGSPRTGFSDKRIYLVVFMLIGMSLIEFVLNPLVQKARDTEAFGPLHGASAILYLLVSGLGLLLVIVWEGGDRLQTPSYRSPEGDR